MKNPILLLMVMFCLGVTSYAQNNSKFQKKLDAAIDANKVLIDTLKSRKAQLETQKKRMKDVTTLPVRKCNGEDFLKEYLGKYESLTKEMLADEKLKSVLVSFPKSPFAKAYLKIIEMNESLQTVYDKSKNNEYKKFIENSPNDSLLLEKHLIGFKELASNIQDYRFVVFELARVFKIIDGMNGAKGDIIRSNLKEKEETEYIDKIDYAQKAINAYINAKGDINNSIAAIRAKIKEEWSKACPEAFSEH